MSSSIDRARVDAADRLLANDGNVLKALADQAPGGLDPDELKAYALPALVEGIRVVLPWPLRNNKDAVARLAGRAWGVAAGLVIVAVEAERAAARAAAIADTTVDVERAIVDDLTAAAGNLPLTRLDVEPTEYKGAARAAAYVRRALARMLAA